MVSHNIPQNCFQLRVKHISTVMHSFWLMGNTLAFFWPWCRIYCKFRWKMLVIFFPFKRACSTKHHCMFRLSHPKLHLLSLQTLKHIFGRKLISFVGILHAPSSPLKSLWKWSKQLEIQVLLRKIVSVYLDEFYHFTYLLVQNLLC